MNMTALDSSLPSNYSTNSTIRNLIDNLMIERWNASPIYERYYNECQPTHCTHTVETRNDVLYIVTTLFAIAGGLITVLKFVVPRLVKLIRKKKERPRPAPGKIELKMDSCMEFQFRILRKVDYSLQMVVFYYIGFLLCHKSFFTG
jgi:hypothetical protein